MPDGGFSLYTPTSQLESMLAALLTLLIMGELGIRVGSGNAAMPKVTAAATMAAAFAGGGVLGVLFSRYARTGSSQSGMTAEKNSIAGEVAQNGRVRKGDIASPFTPDMTG
jgi:hypothetical protein